MDINKKIEKYDYVSFDVFDTLIFRNVLKPTDLFHYVGIAAQKEGIHINEFMKVRVNAESRTIASNKKTNEVLLEDIYKNIPFESEQDRMRTKEIELQMELDFCEPNPQMYDTWKYCKDHGKCIIITSDMYLPQSSIEAMLAKCGYSYDYIFVSSEIGIRKSSGKLFKYVAKKLGVKTKQIIHIGDNKKSDYIMPRMCGLDSILYVRHKSKFAPYKCVDTRKIDSRTIYALKNNLSFYQNDFFAVGVNALGPLLVGFCQWIVSECSKMGINKILFFARDGYIVQKAFNILYPDIDSHYVAISRRSVTVPQLIHAKSMSDIMKIVPYVKRRETWVTFMHKLGIDEQDPLVAKLVEKYGLEISKDQLLNNPKYASVFDEIIQIVRENASQEMVEARKYLDRYFLGDVAIVDIGWYGTMQQTLRSFYKDNPYRREGFYIGLIPKEGYDSDSMQGFIYDYLHKTPFNEKLIYGFNGLIESFFSANHGSTKKYSDEKPVFEEWESENWPIINKVHDGAIAFCRKIKPLIDKFDVKIDCVEAYSELERIMCKPRMVDIELFNKLVFFDTYYEPLVRYSGLKSYILQPKRLLTDLLASNWKIGFLKKMTKSSFADRIYLLMERLK